MAPNKLPGIVLVLLLLPAATGLAAGSGAGAAAFDITKILAGFPEFSALNTLISKTGLAPIINAREAVTLLAPNNSAIDAAARASPGPPTLSFLTDLLSLHVILDYVDAPRLAALQHPHSGNGSVVTTLLQASRKSLPAGAGVLRVTCDPADRAVFSSAAPGGAAQNATFVRQVAAEQYSVAVLQVSGFVVPPAIKALPPAIPPMARQMGVPPPRRAPVPAPAPTARPPAFDICKILAGFPEFSALHNLINKTGLAPVINSHPIVTILAPNNTAIEAAARATRGRPPLSFITDLVSLHVVLEYIDAARLASLQHPPSGQGPTVLATLLQATRSNLPRGDGFLRVGCDPADRAVFASAAPGGAPKNATFVRQVAAQPYSVVVLQVSNFVVPPGIVPPPPMARQMGAPPPSRAPAPMPRPPPFDITKILSGFPEFSALNSLIMKTGLASVINSRPAVTILAPNNTAIEAAARATRGHPPLSFIADLVSLHVVLDYIDTPKLGALQHPPSGKGPSILTTLLQTTRNNLSRGEGFLRVGCDAADRATFSSAGAPQNATFVRQVAAQPCSVAVLQVSGFVVPPEILPSPMASQMGSPPPSRVPAPAPGPPPIDITKILAGFPEFSSLNHLITKTGLAPIINSRQAVTILAPNNSAIEAAARATHGPPPLSFIFELLSLHVVLHYVDAPRLLTLQHPPGGNGTSVLTTLLQATRNLPRGAGFLRVSCDAADRAVFSSAAPGGGGQSATFVRQVAAQPSSVAVMQVSGFVFPPGIKVPQPFPPRARQMATPPPSRAPAPAPGPQAPMSGSGPLVPSPVRPVPSPNLTGAPPPAWVEEESGIIPIPSVHGGMAAKIPDSNTGGRAASRWSGGVGAAFVIMACLVGSL